MEVKYELKLMLKQRGRTRMIRTAPAEHPLVVCALCPSVLLVLQYCFIAASSPTSSTICKIDGERICKQNIKNVARGYRRKH